MKKTLILFVLLFSSFVFAEDISDFEIEGMSIGDSLLEYFSEEIILNSIMDYDYADDEFYQLLLLKKNNNFKVYEALQINLKTNDKNYIIYY